MINKIRQEKIKDYTFSDISKYLDMVLDLVPWAEFSQHDFLECVASADVLPKVFFKPLQNCFTIEVSRTCYYPPLYPSWRRL